MAKGRTLIFTLLYASEGAPIGFIWWALPTLLRSADVSVADITSLTALLVLPWVFKFTWAPLVDALRGPRWGYRAWIMSAQLTMAATLAPLLWLDPVADFATWRLLLLAHAIAAATQDIAIDALVIGSVPPHERGRLNGAMQAGMLLGRSAFGGGVLLVGATWGLTDIIATLIAWIAVPLMLVPRLKEPAPTHTEHDSPSVPTTSMGGALREALRLRSTWLGLGFALTGAAGFEAAGQLAGPFLVDRGVNTDTIGVFFGVYVVSATLAGGLLGGWVSDRSSRTRILLWCTAAVVVTVAAVGLLDLLARPGATILIAALVAMYLAVGLFTVTSYAWFMDLTHPRLGATQFTTFMAATNACESWSAWAAGQLTTWHSYGMAMLVMAGVSLAAAAWLLPAARRGRPTPSPTSR